jgi:hypothetical protein
MINAFRKIYKINERNLKLIFSNIFKVNYMKKRLGLSLDNYS